MNDTLSQIASAWDAAREFTHGAAAAAGGQFDPHIPVKLSQLRMQLASRSKRDVRSAMRRVVFLMATEDANATIDVRELFADVVKNVASSDDRVRRLVCVYLQRFAAGDPELALLAVNALQKLMADSNGRVRALALKTLADMRLPALNDVLWHILTGSLTDPATEVRCAAASVLLTLRDGESEKSLTRNPQNQSISEHISVDHVDTEFDVRTKPTSNHSMKLNETLPADEQIDDKYKQHVQALLSDSDPRVVSCAISLIYFKFGEHLDWLHGQYRRMCTLLPRLNSWAQAWAIRLLVRYCKLYIERPNFKGRDMPYWSKSVDSEFLEMKLDPDLASFVGSCEALIRSNNPDVTMALVHMYWQFLTPAHFARSGLVSRIVQLATVPEYSHCNRAFLQIIIKLAIYTDLFVPYYRHFLLLSEPTECLNYDPSITEMKLKLLASLVCDSNVNLIVQEMKHYISTSYHPTTTRFAAQALAACGRVSTEWESYIIRWLLIQICSGHTLLHALEIVDTYISVIRALIQRKPDRHINTVIYLAEALIKHPSMGDRARAEIISLTTEFIQIEPKFWLDILRQLLPRFSNEGPETREQILLLSAKLLSFEVSSANSNEKTVYDSREWHFFNWLSALCTYDQDFEIRDRARLYTSLFRSGKFEIAALLLEAPKPTVTVEQLTDLKGWALDPDLVQLLSVMSWDDTKSKSPDLREETPVKDYNRYKKSFSSNNFVSPGSTTNRSVGENSELFNETISSNKNTANFVSRSGKKYRLQTLDEFFADVPETPKFRKPIRVEEESNNDDITDSEDSNSSSEIAEESSSSEYEPSSNSDENLHQ